MNRRKFIARFLPLALTAGFSVNPARANTDSDSDSAAAEKAAFAKEMAARHGLDEAEVLALLNQFRANDRVIALMDAPRDPSKKVWWREYRRRHLTARVINNGAAFWRRHARLLAAAQREYGVPAAIITAVLGVETRYGGYLGDFGVAESLITLAFYYPRRADYYREELEAFLLNAREDGGRSLSARGSFAGASGLPQFMPNSARRLAVDFDKDGVVDLFSPADAVGSIANFLKEHGWRRNLEVAYPVEVDDAAARALLERGIVPHTDGAAFAAAGVDFINAAPPPEKLALVDLENEDSVEYRAGTANYYALTRYNRSNKYAMAVLDLSRAIAERAGR